MTKLPSVLITGASSGIGATYADRFARRGHDMVLVARDAARMETPAAKLRQEAGASIDIILADLTSRGDLTRVEARLRDDPAIGILLNNAGAGLAGAFDQQSIEDIERLVALNTTAVARLANVAANRFANAGTGSTPHFVRSPCLAVTSPLRGGHKCQCVSKIC